MRESREKNWKSFFIQTLFFIYFSNTIFTLPLSRMRKEKCASSVSTGNGYRKISVLGSSFIEVGWDGERVVRIHFFYLFPFLKPNAAKAAVWWQFLCKFSTYDFLLSRICNKCVYNFFLLHMHGVFTLYLLWISGCEFIMTSTVEAFSYTVMKKMHKKIWNWKWKEILNYFWHVGAIVCHRLKGFERKIRESWMKLQVVLKGWKFFKKYF